MEESCGEKLVLLEKIINGYRHPSNSSERQQQNSQISAAFRDHSVTNILLDLHALPARRRRSIPRGGGQRGSV